MTDPPNPTRGRKAGASRRTHLRGDLGIAFGAILIAIAATIPQYFSSGGQTSIFLRTGTYGDSRTFVEEDFPGGPLTGDLGHDGQQFYVLAATFPDWNAAYLHVDNVQYRARRVIFPVLASVFPRGPALVWGMYLINVLAVGAAAVAFAHLARRIGVTSLVGLSMGANPAMIESLQGCLADGLAVAFALWGVVVFRRRLWLSLLLFTLAVLTRETTIFVPLAMLVVHRSRRSLVLLVAPVIGVAWSMFTQRWLPPNRHVVAEASVLAPAGGLDYPFRGWLRAGLSDIQVLLVIASCAAAIVAAWILREYLPEISAWLAADAALLIVSGPMIVERYLNGIRVVPLAVPALVLAIAARRAERTGVRLIPAVDVQHRT